MGSECRIVVYGAGAVGCYLGGKLAEESTNQVTLVGRPGLQEAVRQHGLVVREGETELVTRVRTATSADLLRPADLVVLSVRTFDVAAAIPDLSPLLGDRGLLIALQNGVGTEEELAILGRNRVLAATLTASVGMPEPGIVVRQSRGGAIALATMTGIAVPTWVVTLFASTGLPTITVADYRSLRWSKLLLNMLGAAQSAILDMDLDRLVAHPDLFRVEQQALREAGSVMDLLGIPTIAFPGHPVPLVRLVMRLPSHLAQRLLASQLIRSRGGHSPTMRADVARGRTEIATLNGAVVTAAATAGIRVPVNEALADLTRDLAAHSERRATFRSRPDRLLAYLRSRGAPV